MSRDVPWSDEIIETSWEVSEGSITLPDEPGLGVQFDPEATRNHPGEPKEQNSLFDEAGALKRP